MREASKGGRTAKAAALVAVSASLAGCAIGNVFNRDEPALAAAAGAGDIIAGDGLGVYLDIMRRLVEGDPVVQAETFLAVAEAAADSPTTTNRLKLALAIAVPGHPGSDPIEAQRRLSALLASGAALLPEERMLVVIHLKEVEQRLILDAEAERLRAEAEAVQARRNDENARRLRAALEENEKLSRELEEAQQKLDAITNIERSIRERENGADP